MKHNRNLIQGFFEILYLGLQCIGQVKSTFVYCRRQEKNRQVSSDKATTETYYMMGLLKFRVKRIRENISEP